MVMRIYVKGFGPRELKRLKLNMRRATYRGLETIASKLAEYLRLNIEHFGLIWRGTLLNSIKVQRIKRSALAVSMVFYGPMLEKGHTIPAGKRIPTLVAWARDKLPEPEAWLRLVYKAGWYVRPRPFISNALDSIIPQIPFLMSLKLKKVRK